MQVTFNLTTLTKFIDEISAAHGSVEKDAEIIKSILSGWKSNPEDFSRLKAMIEEMLEDH